MYFKDRIVFFFVKVEQLKIATNIPNTAILEATFIALPKSKFCTGCYAPLAESVTQGRKTLVCPLTQAGDVTSTPAYLVGSEEFEWGRKIVICIGALNSTSISKNKL